MINSLFGQVGIKCPWAKSLERYGNSAVLLRSSGDSSESELIDDESELSSVDE